MKKISINGTNKKLEYLFSKFNERFYDGKLQHPVILTQTDHTKKAYGWCTTKKVWKELSESSDNSYYEITIAAEYLNRTFEETCATILHEMVHLWDLQNGVQDVSRGGYYHNKHYKLAAEAHGLIVKRVGSYGWMDTTLNDDAREFINTLPKMSFDMHRSKHIGNSDSDSSAKSKQIHRKYQCPVCRKSFWSTSEIHGTCEDCKQPFMQVKTC